MSELSSDNGGGRKRRQRSSSPPMGEDTSPLGPPAPNRPHMDRSSPTSHLFSPPSAHALSSEVDLSSPLTYGTPSSRIGGPGSSRAHTPIRPRSDIGSQQQRIREINLAALGSDPGHNNDPNSGGGVTSDTGADAHMVIWGTDVNVSETKKQFMVFLRTFVNDPLLDEDNDGGALPPGEVGPYYLQRLEETNINEDLCLNINAAHIKLFNPDLYSRLVRYPQEVIPIFDLATNEVFNNLCPDHNLPYQIQVRPFNVDHTKNMRLLNPEDIDQLINISGMVIRTSPITPEMREAFFQCYICHDTKTVEIDRGRIAEPAVCTNCQSLHSMSLIHNRSLFTDRQMIKLQESPEDMPSGQTPHTIHLYSHHDLVDKVQPGDRITVTGIYRAVPYRVNPRMRTIKAVFKTYIDVVHFKKMEKGRLREREDDDEEIGDDIGHKSSFTDERIQELTQLSKTPDIYQRLAKALAPSIFENDDIKKGILLQLFGGSRKDFQNTGHGRFRSEINILLCGDPGTSKSQLLKYVHNLMPRGQYTSGKGSSAVGLTAYVTKDPETRQLVLQTGALVLSDNGICCIDEFDKMNEGTRSVLHEVMEQQTLSIAKAGIICSLNARTSILAAANPRMSRWDERMTVVENIQLPHTLLSRFDLIFLMLDPQDEQFDRRLATHLVSLYHHQQTQAENEAQTMDMATLRDYIAYSRINLQPVLSDEAGDVLAQAYVDMRKMGSSNGAVTAYPRQLESLIRLSEAHAKMRFSKLVEIVDVEEAKRLHREALKQAATDPHTGIIDVSILTTGMSASERQRREALVGELKKLLQNRMKGGAVTMTTTALFEAIKEQAQTVVTQPMLDAALKMLHDEEFIVVSAGTIRLT